MPRASCLPRRKKTTQKNSQDGKREKEDRQSARCKCRPRQSVYFLEFDGCGRSSLISENRETEEGGGLLALPPPDAVDGGVEIFPQPKRGGP